MALIVRLLVVLAFSVTLVPINAAPQVLEKVPIDSPEATYSANVEWDDAGFIGRLRMLLYGKGRTDYQVIELPQIKPAPANLTWITETWAACESFVAENGAAFFYADALRNKGYLLEILAPESEADWIISYTTNDAVSSSPIRTLSDGKSSLYPILLRNLPEDGHSYFSPDFTVLLADAVDSFCQWRQKERFVELKFLSDITHQPKLGDLVVASFDNIAELVYFPRGTTTTREMLALSRRQKLPDSLQQSLQGVNPPELAVEWLDDLGSFRITGTIDDGTTESINELVQGKFEGVTDTPYVGPGVGELLKETQSEPKLGDSSQKPSTKSSVKISTPKKTATKSSVKSKSKRPSRSN